MESSYIYIYIYGLYYFVLWITAAGGLIRPGAQGFSATLFI